jgi:hypothetical protein
MAVCPKPKARHAPNPADVAVYEKLYPVYENLYGRLFDSFCDLADFRRTVS